DAFTTLSRTVRDGLPGQVRAVLGTVEQILATARTVDGRLRESRPPALLPVVSDMREQYAGLVFAGFVTAAGAGRLADVLRYLTAMQRRLDKLPGDMVREQSRIRSLQDLAHDVERLLASLPPGRPVPDAVSDLRWMIEELRVSWWAQELGTRGPASEQRILRAMDAARG
ncbi:MAG: ATP-dependent helicase HrpA, partial [Frankiaceae bacterium]|nr:ATP-dependent helicase HrpA [Frankiaceae bacterium]